MPAAPRATQFPLGLNRARSLKTKDRRGRCVCGGETYLPEQPRFQQPCKWKSGKGRPKLTGEARFWTGRLRPSIPFRSPPREEKALFPPSGDPPTPQRRPAHASPQRRADPLGPARPPHLAAPSSNSCLPRRPSHSPGGAAPPGVSIRPGCTRCSLRRCRLPPRRRHHCSRRRPSAHRRRGGAGPARGRVQGVGDERARPPPPPPPH